MIDEYEDLADSDKFLSLQEELGLTDIGLLEVIQDLKAVHGLDIDATLDLMRASRRRAARDG